MTKETLAKILSYAGIVPFLAVAILDVFFSDFLGFDYQRFLLAYAAVIVSFLAGIHWGLYLFKDTVFNLFIQSNIVALLAWLALMLNNVFSIGVLIMCFLYLLYIDFQLKRFNIIDPWFFNIRQKVSFIVVIVLAFYSLIILV